MTKSRDILIAENESYQSELKSEVDQAQSELIRIFRNALIAGTLAFSANLLQKAFFKDDEEKIYKPINTKDDFLASEITEKAILEGLKIASKRLEEFLADVEKDGK